MFWFFSENEKSEKGGKLTWANTSKKFLSFLSEAMYDIKIFNFFVVELHHLKISEST
jgi:hypothetical protein